MGEYSVSLFFLLDKVIIFCIRKIIYLIILSFNLQYCFLLIIFGFCIIFICLEYVYDLILLNNITNSYCYFLCHDTKKVTKEKSRQTRTLRAFCLAHAPFSVKSSFYNLASQTLFSVMRFFSNKRQVYSTLWCLNHLFYLRFIQSLVNSPKQANQPHAEPSSRLNNLCHRN